MKKKILLLTISLILIFSLPILAFGFGENEGFSFGSGYNDFGNKSSETKITNGFGYNKPVGSFGNSKVKFGFGNAFNDSSSSSIVLGEPVPEGKVRYSESTSNNPFGFSGKEGSATGNFGENPKMNSSMSWGYAPEHPVEPTEENMQEMNNQEFGTSSAFEGFSSTNPFGYSRKPGESWTGGPSSYGNHDPIDNPYSNNQGMNPKSYQGSIGWGHSNGEGYSEQTKPLGSSISNDYWTEKSKISNFSW